MNREQEYSETQTDELVEKERSLLLLNDDYNTFEYVIKSLMEVCGHSYDQAETCAWITHYKGKCSIRHGSYDELKPFYLAMLDRHLYVTIQ